MKWLAILLALAGLGGSPAEAPKRTKPCKATAQKHCKKTKKPRPQPKPRATPTPAPRPTTPAAPHDPAETPTPTPTAGATPTVTPTATPYPSRTGVDLSEWVIRATYRTLQNGRVVFAAANLGEDDHNLSVRGGGREYGKVDLAPGQEASLPLNLDPGAYTLYCSLVGHEEAGMALDVTVR